MKNLYQEVRKNVVLSAEEAERVVCKYQGNQLVVEHQEKNKGFREIVERIVGSNPREKDLTEIIGIVELRETSEATKYEGAAILGAIGFNVGRAIGYLGNQNQGTAEETIIGTIAGLVLGYAAGYLLNEQRKDMNEIVKKEAISRGRVIDAILTRGRERPIRSYKISETSLK